MGFVPQSRVQTPSGPPEMKRKNRLKRSVFLLFYANFPQIVSPILVTRRECHKWLFFIKPAIQRIYYEFVTRIQNNTNQPNQGRTG